MIASKNDHPLVLYVMCVYLCICIVYDGIHVTVYVSNVSGGDTVSSFSNASGGSSESN